MITAADATARYGMATKEAGMILWVVPQSIHLGNIPAKIYCNRDLVWPLTRAFANLRDRGLVSELHSWDGCFCIRNKRTNDSMSLHSWGLAVDVNAGENPMGGASKLSNQFIQCWLDAGFEWGGRWKLTDPMHFQLKEFPK